MVLAWRTAAREWVKSIGSEGTMEEACDRYDVDSNKKITMFEFRQVCELMMNTPTKAAKNFQDQMATLGSNNEKCGNINEIFRMVDGDENHWLSHAECYVGLHWLKDQLKGMGSPKEVLAIFDANSDGKLTQEEFGNFGKMLTPELDTPRMAGLFHQLDVDPFDNFITEKELKYEEECADPFGCNGDVEPTRMDITGEDLKKYYDVPAIVQGRVTIRLEVPKETQLPPDSELAVTAADRFTHAFSEVMMTNAVVQSATPFHKGHAMQPLKDDSRVRYVAVTFEVDVKDGGGFQELLRTKADTIDTLCVEEITKAEGGWLQKYGETSMWGRVTVSYYKQSLPDGMTLYQDFGKKPDKAPLRTLPYTYSTKFYNN